MGRITFLKCAVGSKPKGRDAHPKSYVSRKTAEVQEGKTRPRKGAVPKAGVKNGKTGALAVRGKGEGPHVLSHLCVSAQLPTGTPAHWGTFEMETFLG